jgi:predicted lactoylglutathione lyase
MISLLLEEKKYKKKTVKTNDQKRSREMVVSLHFGGWQMAQGALTDL